MASAGASDAPRRRVPVDRDLLELAFTWQSDELAQFLDLRTGEVRAARRFGGPPEGFELSEDEVEEGLVHGHLLAIHPFDSSVEYGWMAAFAASLEGSPVRDVLAAALHGRGAFRRFKDVLGRYPAERERWFRFRDDRVREAIREWLEEHGIEPVTEPPERRGG